MLPPRGTVGFGVFDFEDEEKGPMRCHVVDSLASKLLWSSSKYRTKMGVVNYLIHDLDEGM